VNVSVSCDSCGVVSIPIKELHVRYCLDNAETSFWFVCPECKQRAFRLVPPTKRAALLSHPRICPEAWFLPEECFEKHEGPPICWDDILKLHKDLANA
jgi:hypothetical protein